MYRHIFTTATQEIESGLAISPNSVSLFFSLRWLVIGLRLPWDGGKREREMKMKKRSGRENEKEEEGGRGGCMRKREGEGEKEGKRGRGRARNN